MELTTTQNDYSIDAIEALEKMADKLSKSTLMPYTLKGKPADIAVILLMGKELSIPPMQAIQQISVVNGRPVLEGKLMLAMIYRRFPDAQINIENNKEEKSVVVSMARNKDDKPFVTTWTMERAAKFNYGKNGLKDNWSKHPLEMLRWRGVAEAARIKFPDIHLGYTPEEGEEILESEPLSQEQHEEKASKYEDIEVEVKNVALKES